MPMSREEIYSKVQAVLVDALGVDEEEVTPNAVIRDSIQSRNECFASVSASAAPNVGRCSSSRARSCRSASWKPGGEAVCGA